MAGANPDPKRPRSQIPDPPAWARTSARDDEPPTFDYLDDATLDRNLIECGMSPFMAALTVEDRYTAGGRWPDRPGTSPMTLVTYATLTDEDVRLLRAEWLRGPSRRRPRRQRKWVVVAQINDGVVPLVWRWTHPGALRAAARYRRGLQVPVRVQRRPIRGW